MPPFRRYRRPLWKKALIAVAFAGGVALFILLSPILIPVIIIQNSRELSRTIRGLAKSRCAACGDEFGIHAIHSGRRKGLETCGRNFRTARAAAGWLTKWPDVLEIWAIRCPTCGQLCKYAPR